MRVLFVCTGNICRSPTAERLAVMHAEKTGRTNFLAASAGTRAVAGSPMHEDAANALTALGGSADKFRARQLTPNLITGSDLVVTMTKTQRDQVLELAPSKLRLTYTLREISALVNLGATRIGELNELRPFASSSDKPDVLDPVGRESEFFEQVASQIETLIGAVLRLSA